VIEAESDVLTGAGGLVLGGVTIQKFFEVKLMELRKALGQKRWRASAPQLQPPSHIEAL
jgi:hypothetical protein